MHPKRTDPAPKYGPTSRFGSCEATGCRANARITCPTCKGEFCLRHREHDAHMALVR